MIDVEGSEVANRMNPSVASVTVAYNEKDVLPRHIDALLRLSPALQEIVIVDNSSRDGTAAMLAERYPQVTVLRMSENLGQAGGWSAGMSYAALKKHHDWVWTFDVDTLPGPEALEGLLNAVEDLGIDTAAGIMAPVAFHKETETCYLPYLWCDGFVKPSAEQAGRPVWFADMAIASGCLIKRDVVEKIGLPRADFFGDMCDFEYCLRARSHGYKIAVVNSVKLEHEIGNARKVRVLGLRRLWASQPPYREYYYSRNLAYLGWWLHPNPRTKRFVAFHLFRHAAGIMLFSSNKLACIRKMAQGFRDGRRASLGIRLRPGDATL